MDKLIGKLVSLLQLDTPQLIDFECLVGNYTRKKVNAATEQLQQAAKANLLSFQKEDYGWRIHLHQDAIKNFSTTAMVKEASEK